jgi:hypothetical protein
LNNNGPTAEFKGFPNGAFGCEKAQIANGEIAPLEDTQHFDAYCARRAYNCYRKFFAHDVQIEKTKSKCTKDAKQSNKEGAK